MVQSTQYLGRKVDSTHIQCTLHSLNRYFVSNSPRGLAETCPLRVKYRLGTSVGTSPHDLELAWVASECSTHWSTSSSHWGINRRSCIVAINIIHQTIRILVLAFPIPFLLLLSHSLDAKTQRHLPLNYDHGRSSEFVRGMISRASWFYFAAKSQWNLPPKGGLRANEIVNDFGDGLTVTTHTSIRINPASC